METPEEIKKVVRDKYAGIAIASDECSCSCGFFDNKELEYSMIGDDYKKVKGYEPEADLGLGCGLPTEFAFIRPGDTVVDMGSGAGNDCFIAARETGPHGKVTGIDMTPEMIERARHNAEKLGYSNVEFRLGEIENTTLGDDSTDIVVSNCVFNLAPDKAAAFRETFRILRPGGHLSISDIVTDGELPADLRKEAEMYAGCISGALKESEYLDIIRDMGFTNITIMNKRIIDLPQEVTDKYGVTAELNSDTGTGIYSITVYAKKPS